MRIDPGSEAALVPSRTLIDVLRIIRYVQTKNNKFILMGLHNFFFLCKWDLKINHSKSNTPAYSEVVRAWGKYV